MNSHPPHPANDLRAAAVLQRETNVDWSALEDLVHVDPAGRGLASFRVAGRALDAGQLRRAAIDLAIHGAAVGIATGFGVVDAQGTVRPETDGPPGALYLARSLVALGMEVSLITDRGAAEALRVGAGLWQLPPEIVVEVPWEISGRPERWLDETPAGSGRGWSHLVSIERAGPSHTLESLAAQARRGPAPVERFAACVPEGSRDVCHNMRGESIAERTAPIHWLFERAAARRPVVTTIGIGDGGNEIGMGTFAWEAIVEAVGSPAAGRIACRVPCDYALVAGVSDWGAYALALAVARLRGADAVAQSWTTTDQGARIEALVAATPIVDGITRRREATVDGLPLDDYLRTLAALRRQFGLGDGGHQLETGLGGKQR